MSYASLSFSVSGSKLRVDTGGCWQTKHSCGGTHPGDFQCYFLAVGQVAADKAAAKDRTRARQRAITSALKGIRDTTLEVRRPFVHTSLLLASLQWHFQACACRHAPARRGCFWCYAHFQHWHRGACYLGSLLQTLALRMALWAAGSQQARQLRTDAVFL